MILNITADIVGAMCIPAINNKTLCSYFADFMNDHQFVRVREFEFEFEFIIPCVMP